MNKSLIIAITCVFLSVGCNQQSQKIDAIDDKTPIVTITGERIENKTYRALPLPLDRGRFFAGSGVCSVCHTRLTDQNGVDVSIDNDWRGSMMANSARDPYWQASVRNETILFEKYSDFIEDKCATCHMPMAQFTLSKIEERNSQVFEIGFTNIENPYHNLAMDGVSCTLCHQIETDESEELDNFNGRFSINTTLQEGERINYGQFIIADDQSMIMQQASGFIPRMGKHTVQSEFCASCHILYTPTIDDHNEIVGEFPEQMVYFEWKSSDYYKDRTCQSCHMPLAQGGVVLSVTGGEEREPFFIHSFSGGNIQGLEIMATYGNEIGATASSQDFQTALEKALIQLKEQTGNVILRKMEPEKGWLNINVQIENFAGHKLPTSFPSRRVWLHLWILDGQGELIFESGKLNPDGSIEGNDNDINPDEYEPHYQVINTPLQVQIYETILVDTNNKITTSLLRTKDYIKDNRLLPRGFDKTIVHKDIAVHGEALNDKNFTGGGDQIEYRINIEEAMPPFVVHVELLYQSIGYRWAMNLRENSADEIDRFVQYYIKLNHLPVIISQDQIEISQ